MKRVGFLVAVICLLSSGIARAVPFMEEFPELKKYRFEEPESPFYVGFGASPISILASKVYFGLTVFELHWITETLDINLISASLGMTMAKDDFANSRHFTFRFSPKFRLGNIMSIGPVVGYEFVSFPNLKSRINKGGFFSPFEPFSSRGLIFGGEASEFFKLGKDYWLKVSQIVYKQTYSIDKTDDGWAYNFERQDVIDDPTSIKASLVFMLQFSLLY